MDLKAKLAQLCPILMFAVIIVLLVAEDVESLSSALSGCKNSCGDVEVPYPFGIGNSSIPNIGPCFLEEPMFKVTCIDDSILHWGTNSENLKRSPEVLHIDIFKGQNQLLFYVGWYCSRQNYSRPWLRWPSHGFSISSKENKFITVGYDSYGYLDSSYGGENYSTGCITRSYGNRKKIQNGTCSGIGCCQMDIPTNMRNISIESYYFSNSTESLGCSVSFVVKHGFYNFSTNDLLDFRYPKVPIILDWSIESGKCWNNSFSYDRDIDYGYQCLCKKGYEGNPYHPDGCKDIDECKTENHTCIPNHCRNTDGSHECFCPEGQSGNGTKEGGCHKQDVLPKVAIGASVGFIILSVASSSLYMLYQRRKLLKLKEKFFKQNGGFILLRQLSKREDASGTTQIFKEDELKKATNNYEESLIIGRGGFGTVYKGILADNRIVAIKKSKIMDATQVEQFINEVVVLSQINHRNVVKLLGCCLETQVPLLVYEFISNGTLFDLMHTSIEKANNAIWKTRLRIAAEIAGALSYLHSSASLPIIHRDVKSANILLDDNYIAKVSDFGASRLVPLDHTMIATVVHGTLGYLDPEYMQTHQLTEKSDVYSFGVVLAELLTGEKPISFNRPEENRSLAIHFLSCLRENHVSEVLQVGILNDENKEEIKEVAILAARCLRLKGEERPSMKEVAMELEGLRLMEKHPWTKSEINLDETQSLLQGVSSNFNYETGDSSSNHEFSGYGSLKVHAPMSLDDGR